MERMFTTRHALWHIIGQDLAESIIADMGAEWAKVAAAAELKVKSDEGVQYDHIDRFFLNSLDYESGKIGDTEWHEAKDKFRQDHLKYLAEAGA